MRIPHSVRLFFAIFNRHVAVFVLSFLILFFDSALAQQMLYHLLGAATPTANFTTTAQAFNEINGVWAEWPNVLSSWAKRRQIVFVGSSATILTDFPMMIKLDATRITYADTQSAGQDLRFTDNAGNILSYEIENWNAGGTSTVWVKIPSYAADPARTSIWMYYGNAAAAAGQNAVGVWDANHAAVWHLNGNGTDATVNANTGTVSGPISGAGISGNAMVFSGGAESIQPPNTLFSNRTVGTLEGWFKTSANDIALFGWSTNAYPAGGGSYVPTLYIGTDGILRAQQWNGSVGNLIASSGVVNDNNWHHVALVLTSSTLQTLYLDGQSLGFSTAGISTFTNSANYIGLANTSTRPATAGGWRAMNGSLDEFRISSSARSVDWLNANYFSIKDQLALFQSEQTPASGAALVTVQLNQPATDTVTIPYTVSGTATAGTDHSRISGNLIINSGSSSGSLNAYILRDNLVELSETAILTLNAPPTNATLGPDIVHTITITEEALFSPVAVNDVYTQTNLNAQTLTVLTNDTDANGDQLQIISVSVPSVGTAVRSGQSGQSIIYTPNENFSASDSFTYTISDGRGGTNTATVTINYQIPFTWLGVGSDANWVTTANWLGGVVPGASDTTYFNNQCTTYCDPVQTANISVAGLRMNSSYTGTIAQAAGFTWTIGAAGWTQRAGTFTGANAAINFNGNFSLTGGAYTASAGVITFYIVTSGVTPLSITGGTFSHNNGTLIFDGTAASFGGLIGNINIPVGLNVWNLSYRASNSCGYGPTMQWTLGAGQTITVLNDYSQVNPTYGGCGTGFVQAMGGNINVTNNISVGLGATGGSTLLTLNGAGAQTFASTGGQLPIVKVNKSSGAVTPAAGTTDLSVTGLDLTAGSFTAPTGTLLIYPVSIGATVLSVTGGAFVHNSGALVFDGVFNTYSGDTEYINIPSGLNVWNLTYRASNSCGYGPTMLWTLGVGQTFNVLNDYSQVNPNSGGCGSGGVQAINGNINVTRNVSIGLGATGGSTLIKLNGTGAQSVSQSGTAWPGTTVTIDKVSSTSTQTSAVSMNTAGQNLTINNGTHNMTGFALTVNSTLTVGSTAKLICNGGALSAASYVINGEISCGPSAGITWTGLAGDNLWTTAGNWTNNTIPGISDIAVFSSVCSGANCNVTVNAAVSVKGINMTSSYTGTITQASTMTMTVGTSGWQQAAGTFVGTDAAITLNGALALSGGSYTATSNTTTVNGAVAFTISGTPIFTHNSGTFTFTSAATASHTVTPSTSIFNNVNFAGNQLTTIVSGTMTVNGTLGLDDIFASGGCLNTGTIAVNGNISSTNYGKQGTTLVKLTGSTSQTVTGISTAAIPNFEIASTGGTVTYIGSLLFFASNYTYTSGTVDASASSLIFTSTSAISHTVTPGPVVYSNVAFEGTSLTTTLSGDMTVNGLLKVGDTSSSSGNINTGTIVAKGNVETLSYGKTGTANIKVAGIANQTVTGVATGNIPNFEIISTGGTVSYAGSLLFSRNFIYTSGVVNPAASTAIFSNGTNTTSISSGTSSFQNVTFTGNSSSSRFNITGDIIVNGALVMGCAGTYCYADGGNILAYGDVTANNYGYVGTALVKVIGTGNQLMTGTSPAVLPSVEIASTGGTVSQAGTLIMSRNYTHTSGAVNAGTSLLQFGYSSYYNSSSFSFQPGIVSYNAVSFLGQSNTFSLGAGTLTANGTLTFSDPSSSPGAVNLGTINAGGDIAFTNYGKTGSVVLNAVGATAASLTLGTSASKITSNINIAKNAGVTVTMLSDTPFTFAGQDLSLTSGNLDMAGFNLTINDVLTVASGSTLSCNGGDLLYGSLLNSGSISCPGFAGYSYNWTGAALDTNWNTAGNWSGGVVPTATSVVVFDDAYCGANCNATMNTAVSIKGIEMKSGYTNTITQGASITAAVGVKGWKQFGGTFAGTDSAITLSGSMSLSGGTFNKGSGYLDVVPSSGYIQTGGTFNGSTGNAHFSRLNISAGTFTAPSGTLQLGHNYSFSNSDGFVVSGGIFNHGSGTIELMNSYASGGNNRYMVIDVPASGLTFNNLVVSFRDSTSLYSQGYGEITSGDTLTVAGNLTLKNGRLMNGTILLNGNLDIQCSGGNYSTTDVCSDGGTTLVRFNGGTTHTYAFASGALGPYIDTPTGETITPASGTTLAHFGKFNLTGGAFTAPSGTLQVGNDYYYSYVDGFIVTGGTFTHNSGTVEFMNSYASGGNDRYMVIDVPAGGFQFYNLTVSYRDTSSPYNTGYGEIAASDTLTVLNTLTLMNGHLMGGTLDVYGNINIQCAGGNEATSDVCAGGGTTNVNLLGSASQTISHASGSLPPMGLWALNKTGGSVLLNTNLNLSGAGQDLTITAGTLNMAGFNLTVNRNISNSGTLQRGVNPGCGILTYGGTYTGNAAVCP